MGSLARSIAEQKASQSLPAFEEVQSLHERSPSTASVPMRPCRISSEALPLARPAHRLTACRINRMPMPYSRLAVEAQQLLLA